ncbi:MAG TPA: aminotransferase class I/II-fold pyridoxal phosphate-dependent enzyme, partial [Nitrospiria bacterium]|nr:aminotransferase class I/II-fold pyridoxal phosphate-dependent enzyme [Nitrospiria bacterium]
FHSLSKTFNMTGWRIGFAVGNREILSGLGKVKSNLDSGAFQAIQEAGIEALLLDESVVEAIRRRYQERRDLLIPGLKRLGFKIEPPKASFYVWLRTPSGFTSAKFAATLLQQTGILTTPGNGFGKSGEGYIRMTLTVAKERIEEVVRRIEKAGITG